ncbi:hypothetical protein N136_00109 [Leifsonia aquatica ATCC 14665]|uniref:Uncharacterized protein n=1 Tax=Leifsonia aquatica ATCC 14665 TaxID=1358026 RepID=U2RXU2_LEIAQ|nr:hypothetical protein N136_00109 [Leifsonia aquatica ATCC 14665]
MVSVLLALVALASATVLVGRRGGGRLSKTAALGSESTGAEGVGLAQVVGDDLDVPGVAVASAEDSNTDRDHASKRRRLSYLTVFGGSLGLILVTFVVVAAVLSPTSTIMPDLASALMVDGETAKFVLPAFAAIVIALQLAVRSHGDTSETDARSRARLLAVIAGVTAAVSVVVAAIGAANVWIASDAPAAVGNSVAPKSLAFGIGCIGILIAAVGADAMTAAIRPNPSQG